MRHLILLLVDPADIRLALPALNARRRQETADGEWHILVAAQALDEVSSLEGFIVHTFVEQSAGEIAESLQTLSSIPFDFIYNLSFTPHSIEIIGRLKGQKTQICGYSRHADGTLAIFDDTSAYVHAQVGPGRPNRYHFVQIFAAILGVDLSVGDLLVNPSKIVDRSNGPIVINLESQSTPYPADMWETVINELRQQSSSEIVVLGRIDMRDKVVEWAQKHGPVTDCLGDLNLPALNRILQGARCLISAASASVPVASMNTVPVLYLAGLDVNFWEKGPWSPASRVLVANETHEISPKAIGLHALNMLADESPSQACWLRTGVLESYVPCGGVENDAFQWELLQALYTSSSYPQLTGLQDELAFQRLYEVAELALQNLANWNKDKIGRARQLQVVDDILAQLPQLCPNIGPVIRWFNTERLRLVPDAEDEVLSLTRKLFSDLLLVASVYREYGEKDRTRSLASELCRVCAPAFREFEVHTVADQFQQLLGVFHELSRHSAQLANRDWSEILATLTGSFDRKDYIEVADQLEYELAPILDWN